MDQLQALHTMARRHCLERYTFWTEVYQRFQGGRATAMACDGQTELQQADAIFPRYLVWEAILDEIERIHPQCTHTVEAFRTELVAAGWRAHTAMTSNPGLSSIARSSMVEERKKFALSVQSFSESELDHVEPLEPRRVLAAEELRQVWEGLRTIWNVTGEYWWPLRQDTPPFPIVAFHTDWFNAQKVASVRELLISRAVELIWEIREFRQWGCERPVNSLTTQYTIEEGYWTSPGMDWLIYASHESSVTLAGEWLTRSFSQHFPDCEQETYQGPMSTPNRRGTWVF